VAFGRHASAWLVLAALLALWSSQPFHAASEGLAAAGSTVRAAAPADSSSHRAAHDASTCQICRAAAQTRTSLRAAVAAGACPPVGPTSQIERIIDALPSFEPARDAWPRGPPTARFVLDS